MFNQNTLLELLDTLKKDGYTKDLNDFKSLIENTEFKSQVDTHFNNILCNREGANEAFIHAFSDFLIHFRKKHEFSTFQAENGIVNCIVLHDGPSKKEGNFDVVIRRDRQLPLDSLYHFNVRFNFRKNEKKICREYLMNLYDGNIERIL